MFNLSRHPYFEEWTDPVSGIISHILTKRVAPLQKSFYFVNSGLTHDGRWLWFEAAHPPGKKQVFGGAARLKLLQSRCVTGS